MSSSEQPAVTAVIVDIEGTIAPISFVKEVLFPYASAQYPKYIASLDMSQQANIQQALASSAFYRGEELGNDEYIAKVLAEWTAKDFKDTTLKEIQGQIWRQGYEAGQLKAPLYDDAGALFERCRKLGLPLYSYSSGSKGAQLLFYQYNEAGDLRPFFEGYFDTTIGPKKEPSSYLAISAAISHEPAGIAFYSDSAEEIAAATEAGFRAQLVDRDGEKSPKNEAVADLSAELVS